MSSLVKNIVAIIGLVVLAALGYYLFLAEDKAALDDTADMVGQGELETQEFLRRLDSLQRISLPTDIFSDPRFISLMDFGSTPEEVPYGRETPFALP